MLGDFLLSKHPPRQVEELASMSRGNHADAEMGSSAAGWIAGVVQGSVIVPSAPLPEGMRVQIYLAETPTT